MFFAVNDNIVVEPLPQYVDAENPTAYEPVTQRTHIDREIERSEEQREAV